MTAHTANTAKPKTWTSLSIRVSTGAEVDRLRSAYMKLHGADITEDDMIQALIKGVTAKDLPKPAIKSIPGR